MDPREYIQLLKGAGKALQKVRDEELRNFTETEETIESLSDAFLYAIKAQPPEPWSGLVEYHKILKSYLHKTK